MKRFKVILDTDPGVDDINGLLFILFDKTYDIKLISTVSGNVPVDVSTRNLCHILDLFNKDIPVVKGASTPLFREPVNARHMHGSEGMGGYIPPKTTKHQPLDEPAVEALYRVICENPHEITLFILGPHTNAARLLIVHPDVARLIKQIVFMGGSPYGMFEMQQHISFNIKNDPEAFQIVLKSGVPLIMLPSFIGRRLAHLTDKQVEEVCLTNSIGKFLATTFQTYWEHCEDKRIATNDTVTLFYLKHSKLYHTQPADITVDTVDVVGKTVARFHKRGNVQIITDLDRDAYIKEYFKALDKIPVILPDSIYTLTNQQKNSK